MLIGISDSYNNNNNTYIYIYIHVDTIYIYYYKVYQLLDLHEDLAKGKGHYPRLVSIGDSQVCNLREKGNDRPAGTQMHSCKTIHNKE